MLAVHLLVGYLMIPALVCVAGEACRQEQTSPSEPSSSSFDTSRTVILVVLICFSVLTFHFERDSGRKVVELGNTTDNQVC